MSFPLHQSLPSCSFYSQRLSCDLLYIFSIRSFFIILCFSIYIVAIYLNRNIYVHTFENKHIEHIFLIFLLREPWCHDVPLQNIWSNSFFGTIFVMGFSFGRIRNGVNINITVRDTAPCIKLNKTQLKWLCWSFGDYFHFHIFLKFFSQPLQVIVIKYLIQIGFLV